MNITGIVAEYNPFHKGHEFHINETRKLTGCDHIVVVMSGDFMQRGIPAIMPKHERAAIALACGADLVLELPVNYATGTAERFAYGAVSLLDSLHCVDTLSFGSESGDLSGLKAISDFLCAPCEEFTALIEQYVAEGHSYPRARQEALTAMLDEAVLLSDSNNILAVEYLKALTRLGSRITPVTIKREGASYRDETLPQPDGSIAPIADGHESNSYTYETLTEMYFPSATALRNMLFKASNSYTKITDSIQFGQSSSDFDSVVLCQPSLVHPIEQTKDLYNTLTPYIPAPALSLVEKTYGSTWPVFIDDFSSMLHYKLLNEQALKQYQDVDADLSDRTCRLKESFTSITAFTELIKTKNVTYSRVSRALLHILLNMHEQPVSPCPYARVLGFKKGSAELLSAIKQNSSIPLVTKLTDASLHLDETGMSMLHQDIHASDIYHAVITQKYGTHLPNEYRTILPIL